MRVTPFHHNYINSLLEQREAVATKNAREEYLLLNSVSNGNKLMKQLQYLSDIRREELGI